MGIGNTQQTGTMLVTTILNVTMNNWKDYVGYQQLSVEDGTIYTHKSAYTDSLIGKCGILTWKKTWKKELCLTFNHDDIIINDVLIETESSIGRIVEEHILDSFPTVTITANRDLEIAHLKNKVGSDTSRGIANTNFKNVWYYKGTMPFDAPIFVVSFEDRYGIWKHPSFELYGFKII